jgi:hypothetical protein
VIEDFIHIVGMGMMDFQNSYLMTGNVGKKWDFSPCLSKIKKIASICTIRVQR